MKKILLLLLSLFLGLPSQAQEDSLRANRYVMRATLYGVGFTNILDTYLSPMEYTGPEIRILRESMRMTKLMREIASASQEQSRGIEQVNIAVIQMDETAQQNAALVQQSSAATRSLEEQSSALIEAMAVFKLQTA